MTTKTPAKPKPKAKAKPKPKPKAVTQVSIMGSDVEAALRRLKPVVKTNTAVDALTGVRLYGSPKRSHMEATNMEVSCQMPVELYAHIGKVKGKATRAPENIDVVVAVKHWAAAVKLLGKDLWQLTVVDDGRGLEISRLNKTLTYPTLRREDWPNLDFTPGVPLFGVKADPDVTMRAIRGALAFVSGDDTRPILTGVALDPTTQKVAGTDSYRLGVFDAPMNKTGHKGVVLVPGKALALALAGKPERFDVSVQQTNTRTGYGLGASAYIDNGQAVYLARVIDGQFPDWQQLIPEEADLAWSIGRVGLLDALTFADATLTHNVPVRLSFDGDTLTVSGTVPDGPRMSTTVDIELDVGPDDPFVIGLNPTFARESIAAVEGEELRVTAITPLRPLLFEGDYGFALLMPIRLNV